MFHQAMNSKLDLMDINFYGNFNKVSDIYELLKCKNKINLIPAAASSELNWVFFLDQCYQ